MKCKYFDCGWCYAPIDVVTSASSCGSCNYPEHCPYLKTEMTEKEQIQNQIQKLQEKLKELELKEKEPKMMLLRQGKVDFVDYGGKDGRKYFRIEYTDSFADVYIWYVRRVGEDVIRPVRDVNVYAHLEELYQKEVVKQKEEYPYKVDETQKKSVYRITDEHGETNPFKMYLNSLKDENKMEELGFVKNSDGNWTAQPLGETPQERGERGHKEAEDFVSKNWYVDANVLLTPREAVKQGVVSSTKSPTLYDICVKWNDDDDNPPVSDLIDAIEQWLPKEQSANSQNAYVESAVEGFNDCLQKIKSKLR